MLESWRTAWARSRQRHQDQVALLAAERALSFGELGEKADHWRSHYETLPSWCVGQCQSWAWRGAWIDLPQLLGLWLAGGVWIAQDSDSSHADLAESIASSIRGPASGEGQWQQILFSSGSTGRPKVLVRGWRQALLEAKANARQLQLPPGSRCAMVVNPWFGAATKHLLAGLLEGWCQVIGRTDLALLPHGGELLYATPSQLQSLGARSDGVGRFHWISLTGEACPANLWPVLQSWAKPGGQCLNALGASETGVIAQQQLPLAGPWQRFSGIPVEGKRISLVSDDQQNVDGEDAIGRLQVEGPALIEGLLVQKQSRWELAPTDWHDGCMRFVSNDLARWSESGELELLGRSNQLLKHHGEWIDAAPLQSALEQQPGVRRCQLFAEAEGIVAWLELEQLSQANMRKIGRAVCRSIDDVRLQPRHLFGLETLPLNPNGKLDLAALQRAMSQPESLHALAWHATPQRVKLRADLDSLDQAQLVSSLERTNLLWCGGGLNALQISRPIAIGLIGLGFPAPPPSWRADQSPGLRQVASEQVDLLLKACNGDLGEKLWVGGFSLPAWLAYAVAEVLEQRGVALGGVILLDPVDPFKGTYRWPWRRKLARIWRLIPRRWIRSQDNHHRLLVKSWRQHLLGRWIEEEESACKALNAPLHVLASKWRGGLSTKRAQGLQANPLTLHLATSDHEAVIKQPELIEQWVNYIWQTLESSSTAKKPTTDPAEKGKQDAT